MERLTLINKCGDICRINCEISDSDAWEKLAEYEELEEQGLLIKIPCKVGETVYVISTCESVPTKLDGGYWDATGYYCPYEDSEDCPFLELEDCNIASGRKGVFKDEFVGCSIDSFGNEKWNVILNNVCDDFTIEDFGKRIFLTKEDAKKYMNEKGE